MSINFVAALVAAILGFVVGGVWYSPKVFFPVWAREAGIDEAKMKSRKMGLVFGLAFLCNLVAALNLAAFIGPRASLGFGAFAGLAVGLGWVATALAIIYLFEGRSVKLWLINAGYQVVIFTAMGALIGGWPA